ncbi:dipeptidyl aminopeptidase [Pluteus cervinus]|uniref:Dipeptidyl aminopeptidase n=1 Tax=Pluteus cervinus TaxID=181527 RepID=A0ACD3B5Z8_9AGAR|nr:dipeptidyl aminopeptidase [Pluteus cervinus]
MVAPKYDRLVEDNDEEVDHDTSLTRGGYSDDPDTADVVEEDKRGLGSSAAAYGRPPTYYGEGPFDAPSSDEDETLLDKGSQPPLSPNLVERGNTRVVYKSRPSSLRCLIIFIASVVVFSIVVGVLAANSYVGSTFRTHGSKKITMDHVFNGTFSIQKKSLHWVPEAGDGVFSIEEGGVIRLVDLKTNVTRTLVTLSDVTDIQGNRLLFSDWQLSADMQYLLLKADRLKQWRWSSFGNYYVHNIEAKTTHPIIPPSNPPTTAYATWSPTGQSIAYVTHNDLYVLTSPEPDTSPIRVTSSGNASLFHGVPDWVYEEEVFSADFALWWAPDSNKLAFLAFDETLVDEFSFPVYNPTNNADTVIPYTSEVVMKYPKPGYNNPLVSVHVFDLKGFLEDPTFVTLGRPAGDATIELDWNGKQAPDNSIILEVAWVTNSTLIVKEVNRNADDGSVVVFQLGDQFVGGLQEEKSVGKVTRKLGKGGEEGDDGWIDNSQTIHPLPAGLSFQGTESAYLDIVPTPDGYNHIALFSPVDTTKPIFLTSGPWEVTSRIQAVDVDGRLVYFEATSPNGMDRHIYSISLPVNLLDPVKPQEPTSLTDRSKLSAYSSSFSPQAGFYVLSYNGPNVPWQKVIKAGDSAFDYSLTTNEKLLNATLEYEAPNIVFSTIESDGYELNVKEIRPPRMDDSGRTKYPVLFRVYGGPGSQTTELTFSRDWDTYVTCGLQYILVIVDGRGTGFKGRKLRNPVKGNLGYWETVDQISAARIWASKNYVDPKRIGIWGWSYGGFMSSKVVEANAGIHSLAMSVAPVTSWRLYDSIYTERYMNLPEVNPGGYINASISNVTGFTHVEFLLAHGSGDDNVHYANSAHLLDMFTQHQVRNFRFRMFTDSDHSISKRGGRREVYEYLTGFLIEKWGKGGRRRNW